LVRQKLITTEDGDKYAAKESTAKLLETATNMLKNGVTPDVVQFLESTITEIETAILPVITDEHNRDQARVNRENQLIHGCVDTMQEECNTLQTLLSEREGLNTQHHQCRHQESVACATSRKCEYELEQAWNHVRTQETILREYHSQIHEQWCEPESCVHPYPTDPFQWTLTQHNEGAETGDSTIDYPTESYSTCVATFRHFSHTKFGLYKAQLVTVTEAWTAYNTKLEICRGLETTLESKVDECDGIQTDYHDKACEHYGQQLGTTRDFDHCYYETTWSYNLTVAAVQELERDRKNEWRTLHVVTCLMRTVYTHTVHAIESGEPCPTIESHPDQTQSEINYCHVMPDDFAANLTIIYPPIPPPPPCPPVSDPPCTAEYIWEDHGSFPSTLQTTHHESLTSEGLVGWNATLSTAGWAGCAAPKACTPCSGVAHVLNTTYYAPAHTMCKPFQLQLEPGQSDSDTFRCRTNSTQCILASQRCNGVTDCEDGTDEDGCSTPWGSPASLQVEECRVPFVADVQFQCRGVTNMCLPIEGRCDGTPICPDASDEDGCSVGSTALTVEATTGFYSTVETQTQVHSHVFVDRDYTFDSLGSFAGKTFIKMSNDDKYTPESHVQMKLRLPHPMTVYLVLLADHTLPWLTQEGWALNEDMEGVTYHGRRNTRHKEWSLGQGIIDVLPTDNFSANRIYSKTFPAGLVELRGNSGGDGSYLIFLDTA
jgi:hypothetical protein